MTERLSSTALSVDAGAGRVGKRVAYGWRQRRRRSGLDFVGRPSENRHFPEEKLCGTLSIPQRKLEEEMTKSSISFNVVGADLNLTHPAD
ncbi:hypothetical protein ACG04R_16205 [Roseateles sp. BYS78W]|uniref:Uncharacterized protein n=1 Tax=Pelomonas candidula TaxID=3299025 RepID=A0ABW7HEI2_9BURK